MMLASAIVTAQFVPLLMWSAQGGSAPPAVAAFSSNVRVNSGGTPFAWQVEPTMVVGDDGIVHAGWKEAFTDTGGGRRVAFSRSADGGESWSSNVLMPTSNPGALASDPWLIKDGVGRIHFVRLEYNQAGTVSGITVSNTTDGFVWGSTNYMDDTPNFADKETVWADPAGNLYMAYNSNTMVNDMRFRKSADGGATWTPRVRVPDSIGNVIGAYIVRDSAGRIFVSWADYNVGNIMIDSSPDGGSTWGSDVRVNDVPGTILDTLPTNWNISMPAVALDSTDNLYVIWTDYRLSNSYGDIYASSSMDHGATWSPAVKVNDDAGPAGQRMADIAMDAHGVLHAAWYDHRNGGYDVYYSNSSDGGQTWSANLRVSTVTTSRFYERPGDYIAIRTNPVDDNVYVVWTDGRGTDFDIFFAALRGPTATQWITTNPPGLEILIDGVQYTAPQTRNWGIGEIHEIGTIDDQAMAYGARYSFLGWDDMGPMIHNVSVTGSANYTAFFMLKVYLNVTSPYGSTTGSGWYDFGSMADGCVDSSLVQQTADTRHRLEGWGEDATGQGLCTDSLVMVGPKNATALWKTQYFVTAASPHGTIIGDGWHDEGNSTSLTLSVGLVQISGSERARFVMWSGDASGTGLISISFIVDYPKTASALWQSEYLLTIISSHGNPVGGGWYGGGTTAPISIESMVDGPTGTRHAFAGWSGAITSANPATGVLMNGPSTVTADWRTEHYVEVVSDHGMVNGTGWYEQATMANISAPAQVIDQNGTWRFTDWSGGHTSTNPSAGVLVDGPKVIRANWEKVPIGTPEVTVNLLWYVVLAVLVVLFILILVVWRRRRRKVTDPMSQDDQATKT